jgi:hypothetical protein
VEELKRDPFTGNSAVLSEKLGDLLRLEAAATAAAEAYAHALTRCQSSQQKVRIYLTLTGLQRVAGREKEAAHTLRRFLTECPDYPAKKAIWEELQLLARHIGDNELAAECQNQLKP